LFCAVQQRQELEEQFVLICQNNLKLDLILCVRGCKHNWMVTKNFICFGPLTLYLTLHEITFCGSDTVDNLALTLLKIKLSNFPNENTLQHASVWLKMIGYMSIFNKVPVQAWTALLKQYKQSFIYAFWSYFTTLIYMKDCHLDTQLLLS